MAIGSAAPKAAAAEGPASGSPEAGPASGGPDQNQYPDVRTIRAQHTKLNNLLKKMRATQSTMRELFHDAAYQHTYESFMVLLWNLNLTVANMKRAWNHAKCRSSMATKMKRRLRSKAKARDKSRAKAAVAALSSSMAVITDT